MVAVRSRMKQAERSAHSSGRNGGDSRVFDCPGRGVLQKIPTATVFTCVAPLMHSNYSNDERMHAFRHLVKAPESITAATRFRAGITLQGARELDLLCFKYRTQRRTERCHRRAADRRNSP